MLDVYVNLRKGRGQPLVEAKIDTMSGAQLFRREGVKLAKDEHAEFASLFFSNSVTQATRVRIEVLKALSKKLTTTTELAYVQGFISRPVLQFRVKEGARSFVEGTGRSYNYVDAIQKFGARLLPRDLTTAYTRAGATFAGAMSQYFVVMSDDHLRGDLTSSANRVPVGRRGGFAPGGTRSRGAFGHRTLQRSGLAIDRGLKRSGDHPTEGPSKKKENEESVSMSE